MGVSRGQWCVHITPFSQDTHTDHSIAGVVPVALIKTFDPSFPAGTHCYLKLTHSWLGSLTLPVGVSKRIFVSLGLLVFTAQPCVANLGFLDLSLSPPLPPPSPPCKTMRTDLIQLIKVVFGLALLYYFAYRNGVDVIPGGGDEIAPTKEHPEQDFLLFENKTLDKAEPGVVRLHSDAGKPITETEEAKLRPLLEALEEALENKANDALIRKKINKLQILPSQQVDLLDQQTINKMLVQFGATASSSEHLNRGALAGMAIVQGGYSGVPVFFQALIYNLLLPFLPKGHAGTTAGRHDDGGRTWFGLKRADLAMYLIIQYGVMFTANTWVFLKTYGMSIQEREKKGTAGKQFRSLFLNVRRLLDLLIAGLFAYVGTRLLAATPENWLVGGFFSHNLPMDPSECTAEFHETLAGEMHFAFLVFSAFQMFETIVIVLNMPIFSPDQVTGRLSGLPVWFWYLVLYFSPYDDAALPMLLECFRLASSAIFRFFQREDTLFGPLTQGMELVQMIATVFFECHYPKVLFIRLPNLIHGTITLLWNIRWLCQKATAPCTSGIDWVSSENVESVTVFVPVPADASLAKNVPRVPGQWIEKKNVKVRLAKSTMKVEMEGAMREVLHLYDVEGLIFKEQLRKDGLVDLDPHRLVYKQYKIKDDLKSAGESIQSLTFRDAYMQHLSSVYAKEFNKNIPNKSNRIAFAPVGVMLYKGQYFGVECYLQGHYQRYGNNHFFPEALLSRNETPGCFSHFTYEHTYGTNMVADIQGVEHSKGSLRYIFTDPQVHSNPRTGEFGVGNMGGDGMESFFAGHICGNECKSMSLRNRGKGLRNIQMEKQFQEMELLKLKMFGVFFIFSLIVYLLEIFLASYLPTWNFVDSGARYVVYLVLLGGAVAFILKAKKAKQQ